MHRLIARDLMLSARRTGLWIAVAAHAALSLAFLEAWSGARVPVLTGATLYEQLFTIQAVFLIIAAPWVAARVAAPAARRDVPRMAMLFGVEGTDIVRARAAATGVWVVLLCAAGWPAAMLAQQMSVITRPMWIDQGILVLVGCGAAGMGVVLASRTDHPVTRWLAASGLALGTWIVITRSLV